MVGWPEAVYAINQLGCNGQAPIATANLCFPVRKTEPRKSLDEGLSQEICALFSPAWTGGAGWSTLAGQPVSCDNSNTGTGNASCGGGACPFLQECEGDACPFGNQFPPTSTTGTPYLNWGMYTAGFGQVFPFDSTTYFEYNSLFATKTTVTCTNADCTSNVPGSPCVSTTFTNSAFDYMYVCSPTYDSLSSAMEFSACLASPSTTAPDPALGNASPTFATCSSSTVSGGADATTCIGASPVCSAVSAGYQAEDYDGAHALTIPVLSGLDVQARLGNWGLGTSLSPGFITAFGGGYSASAHFFEQLNAYSSNPAIAGTFRQSFLTAVDSLSPWNERSVWDAYLL